MTSGLRIGYSFWGFLGDGVLNTPDGGRSHRRVLLDEVLRWGHQLLLLQPNRDRLEAGSPVVLDGDAEWNLSCPELDALILEWRWPIPGRNDPGSRGTPGYTPDLDRQHELLDAYTFARQTPTIIWDKDLTLAAEDPLRALPNVAVCEAALYPRAGARQLLFPVSDAALAACAAAPEDSPSDRTLSLVYVGNQYGRDDHFDRWFAPAARAHDHVVYGKWAASSDWPDLRFAGRVPFPEVKHIYGGALTTIALLPRRYREAGQMTQRLAEATLAGCLTVVPQDIKGVQHFAPPELRADDPAAVADLIGALRDLDASGYARLRHASLQRLQQFRVSAQVDNLLRYISELLT